MHSYREIAAARWFLQDLSRQEYRLKTRSLSIPVPQDVWHIEIVRSSKEVYEFVLYILNQATTIYEEDIEMRYEADGRAIDLGVPVELSGGVINIASLMEAAIPELGNLIEELDSFAEKDSFGGNSLYETAARHALRFVHVIRDRVPLFLHSYLWILWAIEAVDQAGRIAHRISNNHFRKNSEASFPYMAHPPILVATLACTALTEEIGAIYLKEIIGEEVKKNHTSFKNILERLENNNLNSDFDINFIQDNLYDIRISLAHYILKRKNAVSMGEFEDFATAVFECTDLVKAMANDLIFGYLEEQPDFRQGPHYWTSRE